MSPSKAKAKQEVLKQFIAAWRLVLEQDHAEVIEIGFHKRRKRVRFMCDGKIVERTLGQHQSEEMPDSAWAKPEELDIEPEFMDMFGVN